MGVEVSLGEKNLTPAFCLARWRPKLFPTHPHGGFARTIEETRCANPDIEPRCKSRTVFGNGKMLWFASAKGNGLTKNHSIRNCWTVHCE